ncbi:DUF927 domain-containing protein, partial [Escherichia coli]|uniref:DUF927 domain-containing protein n=1 Tax=Escherichia coli TaxID=562 RepID=UPI00117B9D1C
SDYLVAKGVGDFTFPVLPDGSLLLALVDKSGAVTAAQTITSHGEKRLLTGSAKRGAYHAINAPETTQSILIAEGLATALSAHLIRPEALTVAAIDAGNLLYVAQVLRDKFPSAQIIIAADNDHSEGRQNTGRIAAEKAALSVSGWVALPPTDHKADWNDYHQKHGIKCATEAFNKSMYQPQGNGVKQEPQTIEGSDFKVMDTDPLKPRIESREDGIYWVSPRADSQSGEIINNESWLCSPLSVIGTGRDDKDQYLILRWLSFGSETPTTTANVASSLYGNPDLLRLTWYGTALGLANEAAAHNDGLMPLDEVGQGADPVSVSQSAYALFNGVGKLQGAKDGGNRDLKRWRTVAISTGEMDLETFIATSGRKTKAGQLVRLLNIPLSKAVRFHDYQNGKQHADALKDAYQHHHGAAGREWIKWLADHQQQAIKTVRDCESRWRSLIPSDYGEQVHRVAARFAILEGALLLGEVVTGWDAQICRDAIQHSYNAWLREFGTGNKEHQQIIEQTEAFLNAYG